MRLLLIEDDQQLRNTLRHQLSPYYILDCVSTGDDGLHKAFIYEYDLILLDINLPDKNGVDICIELRQAKISTPIIFLSSIQKDTNIAESLMKGANDYITKPFSLIELKARIEVQLRKNNFFKQSQIDNYLKINNLTLDIFAKKVTFNNSVISLRKKEFLLLELLMRNPQKIISTHTIREKVWTDDLAVSDNNIRVNINTLRKKIDKKFQTKFIKSVYGIGYMIGDNT